LNLRRRRKRKKKEKKGSDKKKESKKKTETKKLELKKPAKRKKAGNETEENGTPALAAKEKKGADKKQKVETIGNETEARSLVLDYMTEQNRPYSAVQLFDNLHQRVKKAQVPKILEALAKEGKLKEFVFGKTKIYLVEQSFFPEPNQSELAQIESEIAQLNAQLQEDKNQISHLKTEISLLENEPPDEQVDALISESEASVKTKQEKLVMAKAKSGSLSKSDMDKLQQDFNNCFKEWKTRKAAEKEIIEAYCESSNKKPKKVRTERGIETDEDAKANIARYEKLFKRL